MANPFDQFDSATPASAGGVGTTTGNPFDQFDSVQAADQLRMKAGIKPQKTNQQAVNEAVAAVESVKPKTPVEQLTGALSGAFPYLASTFQSGREAVQSGVAPTVGAAIDAAGQGLTLGFSDEIEAGLRGGVGAVQRALGGEGETYAQALRDTRARMEANKQAAPITAGTTEFAASMLPATRVAGLVSKGAKAANLGKKATAAANIGSATVEGAIAGLGSSEATTGESRLASDVLQGAGLGFLFGSGGELVGEGLEAVSKFVQGEEGLISRYLQDRVKTNPDTVNQLQEELGNLLDTAKGGDVRLADLSVSEDLARQLAQGGAQDVGTQRALRERAATTREGILESDVTGRGIQGVDPTLDSGSVRTIGGQDFTSKDVAIPFTGTDSGEYSGIVGTERLGQQARRQFNQEASDLYEAGRLRQVSPRNQQSLQNLYDSAPDFRSAFSQGLRNAQNINAGLGRTGAPGQAQILDETSKVLGSLIRNAEPGQSQTALRGFKQRVDEVLGQDAPEIIQGRSISSQGQRAGEFLESGRKAIDQDIDTLDATLTSILTDADQEFANIGAGRAIRNKITDRVNQGTRDSKTGKLLTPREIENYNRLTSGENAPDSTNLEQLISTEAAQARTANLSELTPKEIYEDLKAAAPGLAKDAGTLTALGAFIQNPNIIMAGLLATRFGQAAVSKTPQGRLNKRAQKLLFSKDYGLNQDKLDKLLQGDFDKIPTKDLQQFARALAGGLAIGTSAEGTYKKSGQQRATK